MKKFFVIKYIELLFSACVFDDIDQENKFLHSKYFDSIICTLRRFRNKHGRTRINHRFQTGSGSLLLLFDRGIGRSFHGAKRRPREGGGGVADH
jgi:hypothetical protein